MAENIQFDDSNLVIEAIDEKKCATGAAALAGSGYLTSVSKRVDHTLSV